VHIGDCGGHGHLYHRSAPSFPRSTRKGGMMFAVLRDLVRYNIEFTIGALLVGLITIFALLSFFSPYSPTDIYVVFPDQPPSAEFWFGTNSRGQDMFWNLAFAFRNTLMFGVIVAVLSRIISITVGLL